MTEKQLQNSVINYLAMLKTQGIPVFWEKRQAGGYSYMAGSFDLFIVICGKHLEIELKSPAYRANVRALQLFKLKEFKNLKIPAIISADFVEIINFINNQIPKKYLKKL